MSATTVSDVERASLYQNIQAAVEKQDIIQAQKLRQKYNSLTMSCRLPPDILTLVFQDIRDHYKELGSRFGWIACVSHVCCYWREVAFGFPLLWNDILLRSKWAPEMLKRVEGSPLSIEVRLLNRKSGVLNEVLDLLPRTRELTLFDSTPTTPSIGKDFAEMLADLRNAPHLECCTIGCKNYNKIPEQFLAYAPRLRQFSMSTCGISWSSPIFSQTLTSLSLRIPREHQPTLFEMISVLNHAPNLERLLLHCPAFTFSSQDSEYLKRSISLRRLLYLDIKTHIRSFNCLMRHISYPSSTVLHVHFDRQHSSIWNTHGFRELGEILADRLRPIFHLHYVNGYAVEIKAWDLAQQESQDMLYEQQPRERPRLELDAISIPDEGGLPRYHDIAELISALPLQEMSVLSTCNVGGMPVALWEDTLGGIQSLKVLQIELSGWNAIEALASGPSSFEGLHHFIAKQWYFAPGKVQQLTSCLEARRNWNIGIKKLSLLEATGLLKYEVDQICALVDEFSWDGSM